MKTVCICGSFRFHSQMIEVERLISEKGIVCYVPFPFRYRNPQKPSIFVDSWSCLSFSEKLKASRQAELSHFEKIDKSDVVYVVNPSGYVGNSVVLEIGYAFSRGKEIYVQEPIEDLNVMSLITQTMSPQALADLLRKEGEL